MVLPEPHSIVPTCNLAGSSSQGAKNPYDDYARARHHESIHVWGLKPFGVESACLSGRICVLGTMRVDGWCLPSSIGQASCEDGTGKYSQGRDWPDQSHDFRALDSYDKYDRANTCSLLEQ